MDKWCSNRLTVLGTKGQLQRFLESHWERHLHARHSELVENSPRRFVGVFETDAPPIAALRTLSRRWPGLIALLEHETQSERVKGLARIENGQIQHCQISY